MEPGPVATLPLGDSYHRYADQELREAHRYQAAFGITVLAVVLATAAAAVSDPLPIWGPSPLSIVIIFCIAAERRHSGQARRWREVAMDLETEATLLAALPPGDQRKLILEQVPVQAEIAARATLDRAHVDSLGELAVPPPARVSGRCQPPAESGRTERRDEHHSAE